MRKKKRSFWRTDYILLLIDRGLAKLAEDFEIDVVLCLYIKNWLNKRNCHALYESMVSYVGNRIKPDAIML